MFLFFFCVERALIHHPDRHANATDEEKKDQEKKFKEVGEAYTILSDPAKRSRYDNGQDLDEMDMPGKLCYFEISYLNSAVVMKRNSSKLVIVPKLPLSSIFCHYLINIFKLCIFAEFDPNQMFRQFFSFSSDHAGYGGGNSFSFHFG